MVHVADHPAGCQHIRLVEFTDEVPRSPSGKILRSFSATETDHTERQLERFS